MKQKIAIVLITISLLTTSGCIGFNQYIKNRGNDLADCFTIRGGIGYGIGVRAQVTDYIGASVGGVILGPKIGYFGRNPVKTKYEFWFGLPILTDIRFYDDYSLPSSIKLLGIKISSFERPERMVPETPFIREKFFIEIGGALLYVNFDAGFNPVEFADFLLGWFGIDITGDD